MSEIKNGGSGASETERSGGETSATYQRGKYFPRCVLRCWSLSRLEVEILPLDLEVVVPSESQDMILTSLPSLSLTPMNL